MKLIKTSKFITLAAAPLLCAPAFADENLLGYTMGAETLPKGASEAYLWITHHGSKRRGDYSAQYIRAEYEYGLSDRLSASVYLNGYRHDINCGPTGCAGKPDDPENGQEFAGIKINKFQFSGVSAELKKMILSPYKDGLGVALYGEITYDSVDSITGEKGDGWELEGKVIFQKPYMDGQLQWLSNIEIEAESWKAEGESDWEYAIAPRYYTGVSYRFAPKWYIGAEGWIDAEVLKPAGGAWEYDHWDLHAGPSIHYGDKRWWATLTWAKQIAGSDESNDNSTGLHLADHEKYEVRLKVGYNF